MVPTRLSTKQVGAKSLAIFQIGAVLLMETIYLDLSEHWMSAWS